MAVRRYVAGTGMTRRQRVEIASPLTSEEAEKAAAVLRSSGGGSLEDLLRGAERVAEALRAAEPEPEPDIEAHRHRPGYEQAKRFLTRFPHLRFEPEDATYRERRWYASRIRDLVQMTRAMTAANDGEAAASTAYRLGALASEATLKFETEVWRLNPLTAANAARQEKAGRDWPPWQERFRSLLRAGKDIATARRIIGEERRVLGLSYEERTLRRNLRP